MFEVFKKLRFIGLVYKNSELNPSPVWKTFYTYIKLLFKLIFLYKILGIKLKEEKILDFKIFFFDYQVLVALFESIFIENEYFFVSNKTNPSIIDLGSNIGLSVLYFKNLYPNANIKAFEPDPSTFKLLKKTIEANALQKIELYELAISNKKGDSVFYVDRDNPGSLLMSLNKNRLNKNKINVKTDNLSRYISNNLDLLKMDVEGTEDEILLYLSNRKLLKKVNKIIFEFHHNIVLNKNDFSQTLRLLENAGFSYQLVTKLRSPIKKLIFQDILVYSIKTEAKSH